jgi:hypothetical protein
MISRDGGEDGGSCQNCYRFLSDNFNLHMIRNNREDGGSKVLRYFDICLVPGDSSPWEPQVSYRMKICSWTKCRAIEIYAYTVCVSLFHLKTQTDKFPKRCVFYFLEYRVMDIGQTPNNSECYTQSEPFRIYLKGLRTLAVTLKRKSEYFPNSIGALMSLEQFSQ